MFPPSKFFTWISFLCSCHFHHSQSDGCRRRGDADKDADLLPVLRNRCRRCFVSNCCGFHWNATWQVESARVAIRWYGFRFPQSLVSFPFQRCRRLIIVSYRSPFVDCLFIFRFASADSTPNIYSPQSRARIVVGCLSKATRFNAIILPISASIFVKYIIPAVFRSAPPAETIKNRLAQTRICDWRFIGVAAFVQGRYF